MLDAGAGIWSREWKSQFPGEESSAEDSSLEVTHELLLLNGLLDSS